MGGSPACTAGIYFILLLCIHWASSKIVVFAPDGKVEKEFKADWLDDSSADFVRDLHGKVHVADPLNACEAIEPIPYPRNESSILWFVLIERFPCAFEIQVLNAQIAGYNAAIIYDVNLNATVKTRQLRVSAPVIKIRIPGFLIMAESGMDLLNNYTYQNGYTVTIYKEGPNYLWWLWYGVITFASVSVLGTITCGIIQCFRSRRNREAIVPPRPENNREDTGPDDIPPLIPPAEQRQGRLDIQCSRYKRIYKQLRSRFPALKYEEESHMKPNVCIICSEDFLIGDVLRVLSCSHGFHKKCIDIWMLRGNCTCPYCREVISISQSSLESTLEFLLEMSASETTALLQSGVSGTTSSQGVTVGASRTDGGTFSSPTNNASVSRSSLDQRTGHYNAGLAVVEESNSSSQDTSLEHPNGSSSNDIYFSLPSADRFSLNGDQDDGPPQV